MWVQELRNKGMCFEAYVAILSFMQQEEGETSDSSKCPEVKDTIH